MEMIMKNPKKNIFALAVSVALIWPLYLQSEVQIKTIQSADEVPAKFSSMAQKGDVLITDGKSCVLLGASARSLVTSANYPYGQALGNLLGFAPAGKGLSGDVIIGSPVLRLKEKTYRPPYSRLERIKGEAAERDSVGFQAFGFFEDSAGKRAEIATTYVFHPEKGRLDITSNLTNTGKSAFENLSYSLFFDAFSRFNFSPYQEKRFPRLNFRVYQKKGHFLGWVNPDRAEKEDGRFPGRLAPGEKCELRYILFTATSADRILGEIYRTVEADPVKASVTFRDFDGDWLEIIVREALSSAVFYRAILDRPVYHEMLLLPGIYKVQVNFFPATVEAMTEIKADGKNTLALKNPRLGAVGVKIRNTKGVAVLGKVSFLGLAPTKSPYFQPENPVETGRGWEGFKNSCFPDENGLEVRLPVGTYLASASRGPEYSVDQRVIEVVGDERLDIAFVIDRVVETPGLIALDPHVHTTKSDGSPSVSERIKSVVGEGIEVLVATDHNTITDYSAALKKLGLNRELAVLPGCEVTTPEVLHYNTYPMEIRPDETGNGAINSTGDAAGPLFKASREKDPDVIIQVNHPRAGNLGYFNNFFLDQESAATALPELDTGFDILEVLNGPYYHSSNLSAIEDWFHLLNRGYYFPIVGSSDSHGIDRGEPGYSRTYVQYSGAGAERLDQAALFEAIRKGRAFATNGPMISFQVNGRSAMGGLVQAPEGKVSLKLEAWSAPWIAVDEVRLILNGQRRIIFPVHEELREIRKFEQDISLTLRGDTYICLEAIGKTTLFPVLQSPSRTGDLEDGTLPYALTNPVFVDVNGNGRFDPPLPEKIRPTAEPANPARPVSRY
jgi:hypothetical protein